VARLGFKPASAGGILITLSINPLHPIVKSEVMTNPPQKALNHNEACECDARERDLRRVEVQDGRVRLELRHSITSVRLLV